MKGGTNGTSLLDVRVARLSPDSLLARAVAPVVLDEWQYAPDVMGAVERAVDGDPSPGRVILTGSAASDHGPTVWPATGRLVRVPMWGLTEAETRGAGSGPFLERLATPGAWEVSADPALPSLPDYVELALAGQYPAARGMSPGTRLRWVRTYVDDLVSRDVVPVGGTRDPRLLRSYLKACAELTATVSSTETYLEVAGVNRATARAYETLLTAVGVLETIPAWHDHRLKRLVRTPKRVLVDTSLLAALLGVDTDGVLADARVLGRLLEAFVLAQIRPEVVVSDGRFGLHHLRTEQGRHEVDIVVDLGAGRIAGIEVKATAAPRPSDATHLAWLRDEHGDGFVSGVVLHTGQGAYPLGERIWALPVAAIWDTA